MRHKRLIRQLLSLTILIVLAVLGEGLQQNGTASIPKAPLVQPGYYRVISVTDGDTIHVEVAGVNETVRFIGIDTPEEFDRRVEVQCFAKEAADHMKELVAGKTVRLEGDPTDTDRDKYHRLLRYVYLPDGTLVNKAQVEQGYAFAYVLYPFTKLDEFRAAENEARTNNRGLWAGCQVHKDGQKEQTQGVAPAPTGK